MVVWQIGLTWAPSPDLLNASFIRAMEHIAKHRSSWTSRLARAVASHKSEDPTNEFRSGRKRSLNQRGLTPRAVQNANPAYRLVLERARREERLHEGLRGGRVGPQGQRVERREKAEAK